MVMLTCWRPLSKAATESQDIPRRLTSGATANGSQRSSEVMSPFSSCSSSTASSSLAAEYAARPPLRPLRRRRRGRLCLRRALLDPRDGARGSFPAAAGWRLDPAQGGPDAVGLRPARELEATVRGELLLQLFLGLLVPRKGEIHQRVARTLELLDLVGLGAVHHGGDTLHVDGHALLVWERRGFRHGPRPRVLRPVPQLAACEISKRPNDRQATVVDVSVAGCSVVFVQADGRERKQFTFLEPRGRIVGQVAAEGPRHAGEGCALGGQRQLAVGSNPHQT
mmetsp:Transcript_2098/g.5968  ORF Transcript_2098/g.5968 Transcript_2098/m.5968 type:complete len:281 (+) Transcript_2098:26-868(+)